MSPRGYGQKWSAPDSATLHLVHTAIACPQHFPQLEVHFPLSGDDCSAIVVGSWSQPSILRMAELLHPSLKMPESDIANVDFSDDSNVCADGSGTISRSSVTHVAYIVSKFDDVKRDLVRHIGFQGILDLSQITKVDRKFTLWLLTNLDTEKRCIVVSDQCITDVIDFEVARIISILYTAGHN